MTGKSFTYLDRGPILDIGSGPNPKSDAHVRMDLHQWPEVNVKHDILLTPYPFPSSTFSKIYMGDVLEHIYVHDLNRVLSEVFRIMKSGAVLDVTVPDFRWIFERIVYDDQKLKANVNWLNPTDDPWKNALSYLFGGFHNKNEYNIQGMGHVNAFDLKSLSEYLTINGFVDVIRVPDFRNPLPARNAILKIICRKA